MVSAEDESEDPELTQEEPAEENKNKRRKSQRQITAKQKVKTNNICYCHFPQMELFIRAPLFLYLCLSECFCHIFYYIRSTDYPA